MNNLKKVMLRDLQEKDEKAFYAKIGYKVKKAKVCASCEHFNIDITKNETYEECTLLTDPHSEEYEDGWLVSPVGYCKHYK